MITAFFFSGLSLERLDGTVNILLQKTCAGYLARTGKYLYIILVINSGVKQDLKYQVVDERIISKHIVIFDVTT